MVSNDRRQQMGTAKVWQRIGFTGTHRCNQRIRRAQVNTRSMLALVWVDSLSRFGDL
jgi:hypothetical protein